MDFKITNSFSRENLNYENGTVKNIHYGDIHTKFQALFDIRNEVVPFINEDINIRRISEDNFCKEGDIIFADASEDLEDVGKSIEVINLNDVRLLSGLHTLLARPKENVFHLGFNAYLFKSNRVRTQIQRESQGTKVLSINVGRISKIELSFPAVKEQQKIASFLSLIDERIQTQIKIIEQLETLIKGLSEKLFSQEIRFKGFTEKWTEKKLGKLATFYSGGTPLTSKKEYFDGNIPFIRSGEINSNVTEQFINELGLKNSSAKMVEVGDILYALYGATSGEVAISKINGAINQAVLCIKSQQNHYFIYSYLFHKKEHIINKYLQGGQGNLSADIVKQIELPIPPLEEQTIIANFLSAIDTKIQTEKNILEKYQSQKQYLLQNLFI
ncbi:type I restriction enzyme, S subunit [Epilithonimonas bovis DSM 19482]|uniref:Type I restriction enzyme, S subunit n=3 Tax=Epilithonimonas TaxID=2782229 RepID=A0A1U7PV44_9FLAO|nr:type I restriction enzyme, S subunit [Epilithonimonas bovis DSM 19482]